MAPTAAAAAEAAAHPVSTSEGELKGVVRDGVVAYLGVPYAAPPVGDLRWQAPQPPSPWPGVRVADHFGNDCMQARRPGPAGGSPPVSEDCLYLNLWTPARRGAGRLPVMLWVHGGGFALGSGSQALYNGAKLARRGVVVVTINYRLGRFGFFAHPALAREGAAPIGNYGLLDQIAALKWIKANAAAFGGDPRNVTLFGQSAGGSSVSYLMVSPLARGAFDKAIIESGIFRGPAATLEQAEERGEAAARSWGLDHPDAQALRRVPAKQVLGNGPPLAISAGPMIDGHIVPQDVIAAFEAGRIAHVPLIIGSNDYEAGFFAGMARGLKQRYAAEWPQIEAVFDGYGTHATPRIEAQLATDLMITGPTWQVATAAARHGAPTYLYYFTYVRPSDRGKVPGASHIDEVYALFDHMGEREPHTGPDTQRVVDAIESRWVRFARTGRPSARHAPWPALEPHSFHVLEFTNTGEVVRGDFASKRLALADRLAAMPSAASRGRQ
ncbi:MAG: carboxylesterase/lipase family protein [Steroidobacteraceae bacterium]